MRAPRHAPGRPRRVVAFGLLLSLATLRCGDGDGADGPRTIVLLTIDTLRRDRVGAYGAGPSRTPRLDAFAARGTRFHDARTPTPLTLPAHVTMMSGRPPASHGARSNSASRVPPRAERPFALLAEEMAAAGRRTGAFVSAQPLARRYGLDAGFEVYDDEGVDDASRPAFAERPGARTVERARAWLAGLERGARAFLWVHLFEPHDPHPAGGYDADVAAADREAGALLDALEALGRGDAAVVVVADHGEALGELGEPTHGLLLGESVLRVPFLARGPGLSPGTVRRDPVDLADVHPTLLAWARRPWRAAGDVGHGVDLSAREAPADRPRVAEGLHAHHQFRWRQLSVAVAAGRKLEDRGEGAERLYRLSDDAPPWQDGGGPAAGRPEAEALAEALRRYRRGEASTADPGGEAPRGYGAGGAVPPFLDPAQNARLPDPYEVVGDATAVSEVEAWIGKAPPERLLARVGDLERRDPRNPYLPYLRGRLEVEPGRRDFPKAVAAFDRALELGRRDAQTVVYAAIVRAEQRDLGGALAVLAAWEDRVRLDAQAYFFEARWRRESGDLPGHDRACEKARRAVRTAQDRAKVEGECAR